MCATIGHVAAILLRKRERKQPKGDSIESWLRRRGTTEWSTLGNT